MTCALHEVSGAMRSGAFVDASGEEERDTEAGDQERIIVAQERDGSPGSSAPRSLLWLDAVPHPSAVVEPERALRSSFIRSVHKLSVQTSS
jgi:hypothetical protein